MKEHFKKQHGDKFQDCNLGHKSFNLTKNTTVYSATEQATRNMPSKKPKPTPHVNKIPIANAGTDIVTASDNCVLNGTASTDVDGTIVAYKWVQLSGASAVITNSIASSTSVTGLTPGSYIFQLQVTDNKGAINTDTITVTVTDVVPPTPVTSGQTILLDFNGHTVSGTRWNTSGDIVANPANLSSAQVDEIIAAVKLDFAKYNVVVTTDEAIYQAAKNGGYNRIRVIVTENYNWYGMAGGVSFVYSSTWNDDTPAWVFSSLLSYSSKFIGEACSHEAGHTVGLFHQSLYDAACVKTNEYNPGNSTQAPIMGQSYHAAGEWWVGPNSFGCASIQDDDAVISSTLGVK